ncbi:MAG: hypothetical protein COV38_14720 [Bdellovibrionales bacterium CG11_big_fil_rev_8_21_14_0_20_38_13]|nr:MAG: hypothetical protein COW79_12665 [Bdellovibrionales bacterium CG22_combo_CG10-13_8_21_14_all_38_13]PIR28645.1 MAG: hypothetical protein COV38_14720 [Bdellovibrionales bacterium CG11_big_fil_rev_8_21_14_0_20_38_13]
MKLSNLDHIYREAFDKVFAVAFLSKKGEFQHINSIFEEFVQSSAKEVIGKNIQSFFPNFILKENFKQNTVLHHINGHEFEVNYCLIELNENSFFLKLNSINKDPIQEKTEFALSSLNTAIWEWDMKSNTAWFDDNWPAMLGYKSDEVSRNIQGWTQYAHPEDQDKTIAEMNYHIKNRTPASLTIQRFKHKDGRWIRIMTNGRVVERNKQGQPLRFVGINTNISNVKNFELFSSDIQNMADTGTWEIEFPSKTKSWSRKTYEIYDLEPSQNPPTNEEVMKLYEPNSSKLAKESTRKLIEEGIDYDIDLKLKTGKWIRIIGRSEKSSHKIFSVFGIIQDITKRKKAEEALLKSQETLQLALKAGEFGVWEWDLNTDAIYCSPSMRILFSDIDLGDYRLSQLFKIVHEDDQAKIKEEIKLLKEVTDKFDFTYRIKRLKKWRWVRTIANVRRNSSGEEEAITSISWDITSQVELQDRQKQIIEQAEHTSKMKSQFMATVSHEIRTPMSGIIGMTELMTETEMSAEQRETVQTIKICAENLLTLVNDILDYSKLEANKLELDKRPFKLVDTIKNTTDLFAYKARQKNISIKYYIDPNIPEYIVQDEARIYQVLFNIIGNAVKFTPSGQITINVKKLSKHLEFKISDTGIGIPKDKHKTIFESFTQLNPGYHSDTYGTGLGLSISKSILELMGGDIEIESEIGKGATFTFKISTSSKSDGPTIATQQQVITQKIDVTQMKVLIVEDNPINLKLIATILDKIGVQIDTAEDGLVAVEKIKANSYHLVFMDVQMPKLDGKSATKRIRAIEGHESLPYIIALTANVTNEHKEECLASGMDDFLPKPIRVQVIRSLIESYASKIDFEKEQGNPLETRSKKLIDVEKLKQDFDGFDDLLQQFSEIFLKNYATYLQQIDTLISAQDYEEVAKVIHTFKGIISNFQSMEIRENIEELERLAKGRDVNGLKSCFTKTTSLVGLLVLEIEDLNLNLGLQV